MYYLYFVVNPVFAVLAAVPHKSLKRPSQEVAMVFVVRRLSRGEMAQAARVHRAAFDERLPWLGGLHTPAEDLAYFRDQVFVKCEVWGAFDGADLIGFIAWREGWIDQLYVLPAAQRSGVGNALLAVATRAWSDLSLWTFQRNTGACRFYEARGFVPEALTDGAGNEEREPDVRYRWRRSGSATADVD